MGYVFALQDAESLHAIRMKLLRDGSVHVVNRHDTVRGLTFDKWLRQGLEAIACDIRIIERNTWHGYPSTYEITLSKNDKF